MAKIIVGLSGGVDSAVAAYLLKMAGHEVIGVTLRTWILADGQESRCCEIDDAREISRKLDIPYHVISCAADFRTNVTEPFVREYLSGRTPNPCTGCNRTVKWTKMLEAADLMGAAYVATGHYAFVVQQPNGRYTVRQALHAEKDQTYMLYQLTQEQLSRTMMPLAKLSKEEVRRIAEAAGLSVAHKRDSQEICFVPDGDYASYIEEHAGTELPGEGAFVDAEGHVLGKHRGIIHYTVGQRKGLGIALGRPAFVREIRADQNEVVLSDDEALYGREVFCGDLCFMSIPGLSEGERLRCFAKIRYRHAARAAELEKTGDDGLILRFDEPVRAAAPGQAAVFYDGEGCVIGGGVIRSPKNG